MTNITIDLPVPHKGQASAWKARKRFTALRCGRRWGKTQMAINILSQGGAEGEYWGLFAPDYKILSETYRDLEYTLRPITAHSSKTDGLIRLITGGRIDFWTLNNPKAGRSRKYHGVIIDEASFAGPDMPDIWDKAIAPTLLDYVGEGWAMSTPSGVDPDNWFYNICTDRSLGWTEYHAPTSTNPMMPPEEIERLRNSILPEVFQQEYLAEFVDWSGVAFFSLDALLADGQPVEIDWRVDQVFATIDTASKDGAEHDGTGIIYWARSKHAGVPLVILDWDVVQIEASLLNVWLPQATEKLEALAKEHRAREGSLGAWIEDKDSGIALLQSSKRLGLPVHAIDTKLTSVGKEGRAIAASPSVYQGQVKLSRYAFDKVVNYRQQTKNHLITQVCGFRIGQKKADHLKDLVDCFTYGVCIGLNAYKGF